MVMRGGGVTRLDERGRPFTADFVGCESVAIKPKRNVKKAPVPHRVRVRRRWVFWAKMVRDGIPHKQISEESGFSLRQVYYGVDRGEELIEEERRRRETRGIELEAG